MAERKVDAEATFEAFIASYQLKYAKATECLRKDREALMAFYHFPAEHCAGTLLRVLRAENGTKEPIAALQGICL